MSLSLSLSVSLSLYYIYVVVLYHYSLIGDQPHQYNIDILSLPLSVPSVDASTGVARTYQQGFPIRGSGRL